jgi:hypothetical protein
LASVEEEQKQREAALLAATRALWEDLAMKARGIHCPEHLIGPWRVVVIGETREALRLQIYGCCDKLGLVINQMVREDPRISGPR